MKIVLLNLFIIITSLSCNQKDERLVNRTNFKENFSGSQLKYHYSKPKAFIINDDVVGNTDPTISDSLASPLHIFDFVDQQNYRLVSLESGRQQLFGNLDKLVCTKKGFFILDFKVTNKILLFNLAGKFEGSFSNHTLGMKSPQDFDVHDDRIAIVDQEANFFLSSLSGNVIRQFKLPFLASTVAIIDSCNLIFNNKNSEFFKYSLLYSNVCDTSLNAELIPINYPYLKKYYDPFPFWRGLNNTIYITVNYNDTIYNVHNNLLEPKYVVQLGDKGMPIETLSSEKIFDNKALSYRQRINVYSMETSRYFTFSIADKLIIWAVYDKNQQQLHLYKSIEDNVAGGLLSSFPVAATGDSLVQVIKMEDVINHKQILQKITRPSRLQKQLLEYAKKGNQKDNPLLLIYKPLE